MKDFEPKILAFCCEYCGYAAADLAGSMKLSYPPNVKIIRIPCSGRVDALTLLKAVENGVDGAFIFACLEGNCHFVKGNLRAKKRVAYLKELLKECGLEEERVGIYNQSSAMGVQFAEAAKEATRRIEALGPNPVRQRQFH